MSFSNHPKFPFLDLHGYGLPGKTPKKQADRVNKHKTGGQSKQRLNRHVSDKQKC